MTNPSIVTGAPAEFTAGLDVINPKSPGIGFRLRALRGISPQQVKLALDELGLSNRSKAMTSVIVSRFARLESTSRVRSTSDVSLGLAPTDESNLTFPMITPVTALYAFAPLKLRRGLP